MADYVFRGEVAISYDSAPIEHAIRAIGEFGVLFDGVIERIAAGNRRLNESIAGGGQATEQSLQQTQRHLESTSRAFTEFHDRVPRQIREAMAEVDAALRGRGPVLDNRRVTEIRRETDEYRRALEERKRLFEESRALNEQFTQRGLAAPESIAQLQRALQRPLDTRQLDAVVQKLQQIQANSQIIFRLSTDEVNDALAPIVRAQERVRTLQGELQAARREQQRIINETLGAELRPQDLGSIDAWRKSFALYTAEIEQTARKMPQALKEIIAGLEAPDALERLPQTIEKAMRLANQGRIKLSLDLSDLEQADQYLGSIDGMKARVLALMEAFQQANRTVPEFLNRFWAQLNDPKPADNLAQMARQLVAFEQKQGFRLTFEVDDAGQVERLARRTTEIQQQLAQPVTVRVRGEGLDQTADKAKEATAAVASLNAESQKLSQAKPLTLGLDALLRQAEGFSGKMRELRALIAAIQAEAKAQGGVFSPEFTQYVADLNTPGRKDVAVLGPRLRQLAAEDKIVTHLEVTGREQAQRELDAHISDLDRAKRAKQAVEQTNLAAPAQTTPTGQTPQPAEPAAPAAPAPDSGSAQVVVHTQATTVRADQVQVQTQTPTPAGPAAAAPQPAPAATSQIASATIGQISVAQLLVDAQRVMLYGDQISDVSGASRDEAQETLRQVQRTAAESAAPAGPAAAPSLPPELTAQRDEIRQLYQTLDQLREETDRMGSPASPRKEALLDQQMAILNRIQDLEGAQALGVVEPVVRSMADRIVELTGQTAYQAYESALDVFQQARDWHLPPAEMFARAFGAPLKPPAPTAPPVTPTVTPPVTLTPATPPPAAPTVTPPPVTPTMPPVVTPPVPPLTVELQPVIPLESELTFSPVIPPEAITQPPASPPQQQPPAAEPPSTTGLAEMGEDLASAISENLRLALRQSVEQTGYLPDIERQANTLINQVYERMARTAGRGVETLNQALALVERAQNDAQRAGPLFREWQAARQAPPQVPPLQAVVPTEAAMGRQPPQAPPRQAPPPAAPTVTPPPPVAVTPPVEESEAEAAARRARGEPPPGMPVNQYWVSPGPPAISPLEVREAEEAARRARGEPPPGMPFNRWWVPAEPVAVRPPDQPPPPPPGPPQVDRALYEQALAGFDTPEMLAEFIEKLDQQVMERIGTRGAGLEAVRRAAAAPDFAERFDAVADELRNAFLDRTLYPEQRRAGLLANQPAGAPREFTRTVDEWGVRRHVLEELAEAPFDREELEKRLAAYAQESWRTGMPQQEDLRAILEDVAAGRGDLRSQVRVARHLAETDQVVGPAISEELRRSFGEVRAWMADRIASGDDPARNEEAAALLRRIMAFEGGTSQEMLGQLRADVHRFLETATAAPGQPAAQGAAQGAAQEAAQGAVQGVAQGVAQGVKQGVAEAVSQGMTNAVAQGMTQALTRAPQLGFTPAQQANQRLMTIAAGQASTEGMIGNIHWVEWAERQKQAINDFFRTQTEAFAQRGMALPTALTRAQARWDRLQVVPTAEDVTQIQAILPRIDNLVQRLTRLDQKYAALGLGTPSGVSSLLTRLQSEAAPKLVATADPRVVHYEQTFERRYGAQYQAWLQAAPGKGDAAAAAREIKQYETAAAQAAIQLQNMGRSAERAYQLLRMTGRTDAAKHLDEIRLKARELTLELQRAEREMAERAEKSAKGGQRGGAGGSEISQMALQQFENLAKSLVPYRWQGVVDLAFRFGRLATVIATAVVALGQLKTGLEAVEQRNTTLYRLGSVFEDPEAKIASVRESLGGRVTEATATGMLLQVDRASVLAAGDNFEKLAQIAQVKARQMGVSFEQAFAAISQAIRSGNGAFLEQNRIIESASQAMLDYANAVGKAPSALTETERQMALLNATLSYNAEALIRPKTAAEQSQAASEGLRASLATLRQEYKLWLGTMLTGPGGSGGVGGTMADVQQTLLVNPIQILTERTFTMPRERREMMNLIQDPIQREVYNRVRAYYDRMVADQANYMTGKGFIDRMGWGQSGFLGIGNWYEQAIAQQEEAIQQVRPIIEAIDEQIQQTGRFDIRQVESIIGTLDDVSTLEAGDPHGLRYDLARQSRALAEPWQRENIETLLDEWERRIVDALDTTDLNTAGFDWGVDNPLTPWRWGDERAEARRAELLTIQQQIAEARRIYEERGAISRADLGEELRDYLGDRETTRLADRATGAAADSAYYKMIELIESEIEFRESQLAGEAGLVGQQYDPETLRQTNEELRLLRAVLANVREQYDQNWRFDPRLITDAVRTLFKSGDLARTGFDDLPEVRTSEEIKKLEAEVETARQRVAEAQSRVAAGERLIDMGRPSIIPQAELERELRSAESGVRVAEANLNVARAEADLTSAREWGTAEQQVMYQIIADQARKAQEEAMRAQQRELATQELAESQQSLARLRAVPEYAQDAEAIQAAEVRVAKAEADVALIDSTEALAAEREKVAAATEKATQAHLNYLLVASQPDATEQARLTAAQAYDLAEAELAVAEAMAFVREEEQGLAALQARQRTLEAEGKTLAAADMSSQIEAQQRSLDFANTQLQIAENTRAAAAAVLDGSAAQKQYAAALDASTSALARFSAENLTAAGSLAGMRRWATPEQVAAMNERAIQEFYTGARIQIQDYSYARADQAIQMAGPLMGRMGYEEAMRYVQPYQTGVAAMGSLAGELVAALNAAGITPDALQVDPMQILALYSDSSAARTQAIISDQVAAMTRALSGQPSVMERALKSLENSLRGLIVSASPVTTKGLWTDDMIKKAEKLGLRPYEDQADETVRRALDVFKLGTKSPHWEQIKPYVPQEILDQGEEAIEKWAAEETIKWEKGEPTALMPDEVLIDNALKELAKKEQQQQRQDALWEKFWPIAEAAGYSKERAGEIIYGKEQWAEMTKEPTIPSAAAGFKPEEEMRRQAIAQFWANLMGGGATPEQIRQTLEHAPMLYEEMQRFGLEIPEAMRPRTTPTPVEPITPQAYVPIAGTVEGRPAAEVEAIDYEAIDYDKLYQEKKSGKSAAAAVAEGDEGETQAALEENAETAVDTTKEGIEAGAETAKTETTNPAVTLTQPTEDDLVKIYEGGFPVADALGAGILYQFAKEKDYPGQVLDAFLTGLRGKDKDKKIKDGAIALADFFGTEMTKRFGEKVPADLLAILTENLVPLMIKALAENEERSS